MAWSGRAVVRESNRRETLALICVHSVTHPDPGPTVPYLSTANTDRPYTHHQVLKRVPTAQLQPLAACRPGALVVHRSAHWLGRVDEVRACGLYAANWLVN